MKKVVVSALIVAGFALAALAPGYKIVIVERGASACDINDPDCGSDR